MPHFIQTLKRLPFLLNTAITISEPASIETYSCKTRFRSKLFLGALLSCLVFAVWLNPFSLNRFTQPSYRIVI